MDEENMVPFKPRSQTGLQRQYEEAKESRVYDIDIRTTSNMRI